MTTQTIMGTIGDDVLDVNPLFPTDDTKFFGLGGNDTLNGGIGDDILIAGEGDDVLLGSDGNDILRPGEGFDTVEGGAGLDIVSYVLVSGSVDADLGLGFVSLTGTGDVDALLDVEGVIGSSGNDVLLGSLFDDSMNGLDGDDLIIGLDGDDRLRGGLGNDIIDAGAGNDVVIADYGSFSFYDGGLDFDLISFESAPTGVTMDAGTFNVAGTASDGSTFSNFEVFAGSDFGDSMTGSAFDDTLRGLDGDDWIRARQGDDTITGGEGNDVILAGFGDDVAFGGAGNDRIQGSVGNDEIYGMSGDDLLFSSHGSNTISGGDDIDTVSYIDRSSGMVVDLANGFAFELTGIDTDTITTVENVIGSNLGDDIYGDFGDNTLTGRDGRDYFFGDEGSDLIEGEAGNDEIDGGIGNDLMFGGTGEDIFFLSEGDDFVDGEADYDTLLVSGLSTDYTVTQSTTVGSWTVESVATGEKTVAVNLEEVSFEDGYYLAGDTTFYSLMTPA